MITRWHAALMILIFIRDRDPIVGTASNDRIYEISTLVSQATPSNPPTDGAVWSYCALLHTGPWQRLSIIVIRTRAHACSTTPLLFSFRPPPHRYFKYKYPSLFVFSFRVSSSRPLLSAFPGTRSLSSPGWNFGPPIPHPTRVSSLADPHERAPNGLFESLRRWSACHRVSEHGPGVIVPPCRCRFVHQPELVHI